MRGTVLRTQVSAAARRPGRLVLTGLAVVVASFVVTGTVLAQQITERTARDTLSGTPAATSLVVGGAAEGPLPAVATLPRVQALPGVAEAVGRVEIGLSVGESYLNLRADPGAGPCRRCGWCAARTRTPRARSPSPRGPPNGWGSAWAP